MNQYPAFFEMQKGAAFPKLQKEVGLCIYPALFHHLTFYHSYPTKYLNDVKMIASFPKKFPPMFF